VSEQAEPLWASGPGEILRHGIGLLAEDSDTNRRLALISIDNAVELMMETFIQLPKRITGLDITRKQRDEICSNFPSLLDGIESHAADKVAGINLGEIEWFHRLRNQLYHQGNGLTVERRKVEFYAELASTFFNALFGLKLSLPEEGTMQLLGEFLEAYVSIEEAIFNARKNFPSLTSGRLILDSIRGSVLTEPEFREFERVRQIRNLVVHSKNGGDLITHELVKTTQSIAAKLNSAFSGKPK
jgi:hypothetical protein